MLQIANHWLNLSMRFILDCMDYYIMFIFSKIDYYAPGMIFFDFFLLMFLKL